MQGMNRCSNITVHSFKSRSYSTYLRKAIIIGETTKSSQIKLNVDIWCERTRICREKPFGGEKRVNKLIPHVLSSPESNLGPITTAMRVYLHSANFF